MDLTENPPNKKFDAYCPSWDGHPWWRLDGKLFEGLDAAISHLEDAGFSRELAKQYLLTLPRI